MDAGLNRLSAHELTARFLERVNLVSERLLIPAAAAVGLLAISHTGGELSPEWAAAAQYFGSAALGTVFSKFVQGHQIKELMNLAM
jgi:hypothetical protein